MNTKKPIRCNVHSDSEEELAVTRHNSINVCVELGDDEEYTCYNACIHIDRHADVDTPEEEDVQVISTQIMEGECSTQEERVIWDNCSRVLFCDYGISIEPEVLIGLRE